MKSGVFRRRLGFSLAALALAGCVMSQDNGPLGHPNKAASSAARRGSSSRGVGQLPAHQVEHQMGGDASAAGAGATAGADAFSFYQTGRASWYGPGFHGRRTASGERYDMYAMTAAHRTLPLGTYVRVTVPSTGKSVVVRINDRGAFPRNRVIDLSYAAAEALGLRHSGTAQVRIDRAVAYNWDGSPAGLAPEPGHASEKPVYAHSGSRHEKAGHKGGGGRSSHSAGKHGR